MREVQLRAHGSVQRHVEAFNDYEEELIPDTRRYRKFAVRREKALDFSGCNSRPGTGSLHPVAIEAAAEATKLLISRSSYVFQ